MIDSEIIQEEAVQEAVEALMAADQIPVTSEPGDGSCTAQSNYHPDQEIE